MYVPSVGFVPQFLVGWVKLSLGSIEVLRLAHGFLLTLGSRILGPNRLHSYIENIEFPRRYFYQAHLLGKSDLA
jgi:hypothetical protein